MMNNTIKISFGIMLLFYFLIPVSCVIDRCEGQAFFTDAVRVIILETEEDIRINSPIRVTINSALDTIVPDGLVDLDEWQINNTNSPELIDLNGTHFLEYQLEILDVTNIDTTVIQTDIVNLEYTLQNECQYIDIETMIVRLNTDVIFDGEYLPTVTIRR